MPTQLKDICHIKYKRLIFSVNDNFLTNEVLLNADINYCIQVPEKVHSSLYEFYTLLVDLEASEETIWNNIYHRTRDEINSFSNNQQFEYDVIFDLSLQQFNEFVSLYNKFAKLKGILNAERFRLKTYWENGIFAVSFIKQGNDYLCINFYRITKERASNLYTFNLKHLHKGNLSSSHFGRAHKALHWLDIKTFKKLGAANYDFCGWYHGTSDEQLLSINKFKEQFCTNRIKEYSGVIYSSRILKFLKRWM
jgi:hypothetical protein